jgi:EmrB/QacA subfamily drug resistance transporter
MASLDRNIIVIALPSIASELHTSLITLVWIAIGYWVVTASVLLTFGRLADMFGRIKLYNLGFALFTIGSTLCCVSQTGEQLIVFRVVQALGAAFLFSNSAAILTDVFPENERGRALGLNQISIVVGSVIGLALGGFLTSYLGWRSIFWVNIPIGLFATVWSYAKLRELGTIRKEKIDWFGNATLSGGMVLLLVGITFGSFKITDAITSMLVILGGAALLTLFYLVEKKVSQPMFDLSLFKIKLFASSNMAIFLNALARGAFTLVMVFYLQGPSMRLDPLNAGIYLIPVSLALAVFAPVSGWLYDKLKLQIFTPIGLIVSAVGFLMLAGIGETTSFYESLMPLVLVGAGMGIFASPNRATIMSSVPSHRRGVAAGISTTLVMTGSAFSIGLVFLVFTHVMPLDVAQSIFTGSFDALNNTDKEVDKFMISVHIIFFVSAIIMAISVIPSIIKWVT